MLQAIAAAVLFGASAPLSKMLLGELDPVTLAALLYLGCGIGLILIKLFQRLTHPQAKNEAEIQKKDVGWLAGAVIAGGVAAPILLLFGLRDTPASTASLLLNFESVSTTLIAALAFREFVSRRTWWSVLLITLASVLLTLNLSGGWGFSLGALGIAAACVLWGIDNNFTRNISSKNPVSIVMIKGLAAGGFSLALTFLLGNHLPQTGIVLKALLLGCLSYGVSITLFIRAMRGLGAARAGALFGTSPLVGVALSFILLRESPTLVFLAALLLMFFGTLLLLKEKHSHEHVHPAVIHEHAHRHDDGHHEHPHRDGVEGGGRTHSHAHEHAEVEHAHEHAPDIDHRHEHNDPSTNGGH